MRQFIIALVSVDGCSSFSDPDGFFDVPDSSVGFLVYKHQKLGVVRTLMHRCETITSEQGDKKEEVEHLREALRVCGYPGP